MVLASSTMRRGNNEGSSSGGSGGSGGGTSKTSLLDEAVQYPLGTPRPTAAQRRSGIGVRLPGWGWEDEERVAAAASNAHSHSTSHNSHSMSHSTSNSHNSKSTAHAQAREGDVDAASTRRCGARIARASSQSAISPASLHYHRPFPSPRRLHLLPHCIPHQRRTPIRIPIHRRRI
ncbi:hypothetical protein DFH09DRAFT_1132383 [Mycena vulgaris]|nr:hypothetical protein DFH09DRAFT_1132383 [Mycena vulgaris]